MKKEEVRQIVFRLRREMTDEEVAQRSRDVFFNVEAYLKWENLDHIFLYASYNHETDTTEFIEYCLKKGVTLALPRVCSNKQDMEFYFISSLRQVEAGYRGIPEPKAGLKRAVPTQETVILVPGVGFDVFGNRTGYGKGFYDRYLKKYPFVKKIGVAFEGQLFDKIDCMENDIPMDAVITEKRICGA